MESAIYSGWVRHRRESPTHHAFTHRLFMVYLDLAELDDAFRGRWLWSASRPALAWFRRADHMGDPARPLDPCVRDLVQEQTGHRPQGPIRLLTHLRYFGHCFNPVSFYYCFARDGRRLDCVVAEVHNTPWRERHCYVLHADNPAVQTTGTGRRRAYAFDKDFHVSPFMGMRQRLRWSFLAPEEELAVHMDNEEGGRKLFDATMVLHRRPITGASLAWCLTRHPFMTLRVVAAIHWHALRLWLKRVPVQPYPGPRHPLDLPT